VQKNYFQLIEGKRKHQRRKKMDALTDRGGLPTEKSKQQGKEASDLQKEKKKETQPRPWSGGRNKGSLGLGGRNRGRVGLKKLQLGGKSANYKL